jgi:hypothetical protein
MSQISLQMSCFLRLVFKGKSDSVGGNLSDVGFLEGNLSATDVLSAPLCAINLQHSMPQHGTYPSNAGSLSVAWTKSEMVSTHVVEFYGAALATILHYHAMQLDDLITDHSSKRNLRACMHGRLG